MKKILSGFLFRLFRSWEIWVLLVLFVVSSILFNHKLLASDPVVSGGYPVTHNGVERILNLDELRNYRFESKDLNAYDIYRCYDEPIPQDSYDTITGKDSVVYYEMLTITVELGFQYYIPVIFAVLFIPIFFGRMFSNGTIKNLIACGHSRSSIYLSSLLMAFMIDAALYLLNILILAIMWFCYSWKPPIYFPVIAMLLLLDLLVIFFVSSLIVAVMFISRKTIAVVIAGFLIAVFAFTPVTESLMEHLEASQVYVESSDKEFYELFREKGPNVFEHRFNLSECGVETYYEDRCVLAVPESRLDPALKNTLITLIYLDPALFPRLIPQGAYSYLYYRDGLMGINIASNVFWILASTCAGVLIFRKREIHG